MVFTITLPDNYGYPALVALGLLPFVAFAHGTTVSRLRKPAGVKYPNAYASEEQAKTSKAAYKFNCAQRAHANYLENMSQTMASILFAGLTHPRASAALGVVWVLFRIIYAYGYIVSDKPNGSGRLGGSFFFGVQAVLWGMCVNAAVKMI